MNQSPERIALVERDLRAAARAFDDVPVSADAWQQNQLRLAADSGHRGRILLAVAAALVLVVAVGALVLGGGDGGKRTLPGGSGDDPFGDSVVLGPPVDVETVTIDGVETTHQAVLSDQTGKGPNLCDRYGTDTGSNGGCSSRDPNADDPAVAFDWLTATTGSGDIRGVLAGVDSRVMKVQIWMDNGDMTLADLKPGGWEDTKLFGLTVPAAGPRPQRLVAYSDASGTVLQALDLSEPLGQRWLRDDPGCPGRADAPAVTQQPPPPDSGQYATVRLGYTMVDVEVGSAGAVALKECSDLRSGTLVGASVAGSVLVVVMGPEARTLQVTSGGKLVSLDLLTPERSPWRVVVARFTNATRVDQAELRALDATGNVIDQRAVSELRWAAENPGGSS